MRTQIPIKLVMLFLFEFSTTIILSAQVLSPPERAATLFPATDAYRNANLIYQIINAPNNTLCYDVFADERLMIHQSSIPGLPGNDGFKTKADAAKAAGLVMYKIRTGDMPPTVSMKEMQEFGIIK